ncbi:hypothetical protein BO94DRAFT_547053 [Aspergillus sclerotioniger CBS 115572]|uniref:Uncharacterized protein n=1 Tax=Aspergillus sclerotioniger CBS 115572 TaxID=1450535 RepID=A0A317WLE4_9EURO|nr:hypothetical protein BO94DRAFT_547053 [Aspergillus sclerotioniger CBS 115572]PWY85877.1 hypothetical protein BO94DRAFT_547053 [Aspergillus sclerotioniger CBS 115572]
MSVKEVLVDYPESNDWVPPPLNKSLYLGSSSQNLIKDHALLHSMSSSVTVDSQLKMEHSIGNIISDAVTRLVRTLQEDFRKEIRDQIQVFRENLKGLPSETVMSDNETRKEFQTFRQDLQVLKDELKDLRKTTERNTEHLLSLGTNFKETKQHVHSLQKDVNELRRQTDRNTEEIRTLQTELRYP